MSGSESDAVAGRVIAMLKGVAAGMPDARRWVFYCQLLAAVGDVRLTIGDEAARREMGEDPFAVPARLSDFDRDNVGEIVGDRVGEFSNFSAHVLRLVKKADREQREVLRLVYPDHVAAVDAWETAPLQSG